MVHVHVLLWMVLYVLYFLTERLQVLLGLILSVSLVNAGIAITCPQSVYYFPLLVLEAAAFLVLPLLTYLSHTQTRWFGWSSFQFVLRVLLIGTDSLVLMSRRYVVLIFVHP